MSSRGTPTKAIRQNRPSHSSSRRLVPHEALTSSSTYTHRPFNVVVTGDAGVGKTCLVLRYTKDTHTTQHISTIGVDFETKNVTIDGHVHRVHVWDTAGQERFRTIGSSYYRRGDCVLIVFDVASRSSASSIESWLHEAMKSAPLHAFIAVAGNKCELDDSRRMVSADDARGIVARANAQWMAYHADSVSQPPPILYLEVSARTGERVNLLFEYIMNMLIEQHNEHPYAYDTAAAAAAHLNSSTATSSKNCAC